MEKTNNNILLIVIHIAIGLLVFLYKPIGNAFFIVALVVFLGRIILAPSVSKTREVLFACAYFVGAEVFFRMTKSSLSYESSKYLVIVFVLIGMLYKGLSGKGYPYFMYLILLVPAILVASTTLSYDANFRKSVAFVLSGPVCLGVASLFLYDRKISFYDLRKMFLIMILPLITMTTYLFLYNPSIEETLTGTASNAATSGGFGPNQVSTALGLGIFAIVVRLFLKSPSTLLKLFNVLLLSAMAFRGIVTFSRGGIFTAIICITAFLVMFFFKSTARQKNNILASFFLLLIATSITWLISSNQTRGLIDKRYANQDALGREKADITTGRLQLFKEEIEGFLENPFFGIGTSRVKDKRVETTGQQLPSHNEIGRLLSEHGFLGIVIITILIITPLAYRGKNKKNVFFYAFLAFWFATINHSGMRIAAPSFIYALSLINVTYEKHPLHRKQITK